MPQKHGFRAQKGVDSIPKELNSSREAYNYNGTNVYLQKEEYRNNGTLAVLMFKEDGELYGSSR